MAVTIGGFAPFAWTDAYAQVGESAQSLHIVEVMQAINNLESFRTPAKEASTTWAKYTLPSRSGVLIGKNPSPDALEGTMIAKELIEDLRAAFEWILSRYKSDSIIYTWTFAEIMQAANGRATYEKTISEILADATVLGPEAEPIQEIKRALDLCVEALLDIHQASDMAHQRGTSEGLDGVDIDDAWSLLVVGVVTAGGGIGPPIGTLAQHVAGSFPSGFGLPDYYIYELQHSHATDYLTATVTSLAGQVSSVPKEGSSPGNEISAELRYYPGWLTVGADADTEFAKGTLIKAWSGASLAAGFNFDFVEIPLAAIHSDGRIYLHGNISHSTPAWTTASHPGGMAILPFGLGFTSLHIFGRYE